MSDRLSDDQYDRLRELLAEATYPPPWDDIVQGAENRALAVAAVNALPGLLDEIDRLHDEVASLRRWINVPRMTRSEARYG